MNLFPIFMFGMVVVGIVALGVIEANHHANKRAIINLIPNLHVSIRKMGNKM